MPTATMTSKGQVTVPREVRDNLALTTGSLLDFIPDGTGYRLAARTHTMSDLFGILPRPVGRGSLEDMDAAIALGAGESLRR